MTGMDRFEHALSRFTQFFLLWVLLFSATALARPEWFTWFKPYISLALGVIMFGMGISLTAADFTRVLRMPKAVAVGVGAQYLIMPLLAYALARLFQLDNELAAGVILVGCCPGGTASNVVAYLAKADVALSVTLTACSTLIAFILTPQLMSALGGRYVPVDAAALFLDVFKITLMPVVLGLLVRRYLGTRLSRIQQVFPAISVLGICAIIACVVGLTRTQLPAILGVAGLAVAAHNVGGLALGFALARAFRLPPSACRTVAVETGMQNSGLAVLLATTHFTPVAALPGALFSVVHNLTGSALATVWRTRPVSR